METRDPIGIKARFEHSIDTLLGNREVNFKLAGFH